MGMSVTVWAYSYSIFNGVFAIGGELDLMVNLKIRTAILSPPKRCRVKANLANAIRAQQNLRYNIRVTSINLR